MRLCDSTTNKWLYACMLALCAYSSALPSADSADSAFCTVPSAAKYPKDNDIHRFMARQPLASWYTDRDPSYEDNLRSVVTKCGAQGEEPLVVVYGLPNKDCEAGYSTAGANKNKEDYLRFVGKLRDVVRGSPVTVVLEPDALNLSVDKCGQDSRYMENMAAAADLLSSSPGIKLYVDVGFWMITPEKVKTVASLLSSMKIKGVSLNLSNYRSTQECKEHCDMIRQASGKDYTCIIDTSRNNNGPDAGGEWCNYKGAGIGETSASTSYPIDALVWIKPAIEVDGQCYGKSMSFQTNEPAGAAVDEWLNLLWTNGFYAGKEGTLSVPMATAGPWSSAVTPAPAPAGTPAGTPAGHRPPVHQKKYSVCKA